MSKEITEPENMQPEMWLETQETKGTSMTGEQQSPELVSVRYVRVRLSDTERTVQWREVDAASLEAAVKVAEQMEDVEVCLEAKLGQPESGFYKLVNRPAQIKLFNENEWIGPNGVVT